MLPVLPTGTQLASRGMDLNLAPAFTACALTPPSCLASQSLYINLAKRDAGLEALIHSFILSVTFLNLYYLSGT